MKSFKHILSGFIWTIVGIYAVVIVLLHIPAVQRGIACEVASALENKFNTRFDIGRVDLGFLNRLIIDDVVMYDQNKKVMLQASRLSVKIDYLPLAQSRISISSARIFGLKGIFYKEKPDIPANYQFALDSLASKDTTHTPLDIHINTLILRHGNIKYDCRYKAYTPGKINAAHLDIKDISAHVILPYITDNGVSAQVKKLSLKEASGLNVRNLSFSIDADREKATLKNFNLKLPQTDINIRQLSSSYSYDNGNLAMSSLRYNGDITNTGITLSDMCFLNNALKEMDTRLNISMLFSGTSNSFRTTGIKIYSDNNDISLYANGYIRHWDATPQWNANIERLDLDAESIKHILKNMAGQENSDIYGMISRLGDISIKTRANGTGSKAIIDGYINTGIGSTQVDAKINGNNISGHIKTDGFSIKKLLGNDRFGNISTDINITGTVNGSKIKEAKVKGKISQFDYNSYPYSNILSDITINGDIIDGDISMNDNNGRISISGIVNTSKRSPSAKITATIRDFSPKALKISDKWDNAVFCADIETDVSGSNINNINGLARLTDFSMQSAKTDYRLGHLTVKAENNEANHTIQIDSDFGNAVLSGRCNYSTIAGSIMNMIGEKIPVLKPQTPHPYGGNDFTLKANIVKTDWLNALFNIPLSFYAPFHMEGMLNDNAKMLNLHADVPDFTYSGKRYADAKLDLSLNAPWQSDENILQTYAYIKKYMDNGQDMHVSIKADAGNNNLKTTVKWDADKEHPMSGTITGVTKFFRTTSGNDAAHIHIVPSEIQFNDTVWNVSASDIVYSKKNIYINEFAVKHNRQHIIISGAATENPNDSITLDMRDVDINYILNLVNFHSVEFSGLASGTVNAKSVFDNPYAHTNLTVRDFKFQNGRMGTLIAKALWNNKDKQIDIDAVADDGPERRTIINGYVSPERNYIDLGIEAEGTRLEFLESFCGSFMTNVDAYTHGKLRLHGDLSFINLTGEAVANGKVDIKPLNTTYWLRNDTIRLIPDEIIFKNAAVSDREGNLGFINGMLHHKHLTKLTFDLNVAAHNLLAYDHHDYNGNTFYGTVFATGTCDIKGRSGSIDFDVNVTPGKGSFIEYNAASPDAITNNEFITWRDKEAAVNTADTIVAGSESDRHAPLADIPSDIRINFLINTNPDFTLRVLMDQQSGDHIALNGSGMLKASYYNKGSFDMFGNYAIDHGVYKLTIQNIIKKDFLFQRGSSIIFGGDPYNAAINLKALYTVNGVSLADLHIGNSFSTNNVRVDCFMNIKGTPHTPVVDFDIDLPTVNADAKHMVRSLINSEEEMNQQVIYLLTIGRFYTQNTNNAVDEEKQSQTSLAMQSLLSGTVSQQINSLLSSVINSNNWNLGANISTGDEGWNNAEYEGLLSGRLLNNRLLINGQFGYRDNANATTSFIGDFDIRYLLLPNGNLAIKMYNQTNDRYFTKSSLNTQGIGFIMKKDFNSWRDLFGNRKKKKNKKAKKSNKQ